MPAAASDTIVALSSAAGRAGVAVLRLSGSRARFALETIAGTPVPAPRLATLRILRDAAGEAIDEALVLHFPAPASFTGEDVAEFQVHGSRAVQARLLTALTGLPGLRLAEPGEFTRRAFEAGKLDFAAVEGLADLIDSETEWQRRQALRQMQGALGGQAARWREALTEAMALLAAALDFSDEGDVDAEAATRAVELARGLMPELQAALGGFRRGERIRDGFVVVLSGPPNAGKSSLLNALARREVAIVSSVPGTTRDAIEVRLDLDGVPVILIDTAGLRDSHDPIEREGVRRAREAAARADLVLALRAIDSEPYRAPDGMAVLPLVTKIDLGGDPLAGELPVSALSGAGVQELLAAIARQATEGGGEPALLTRERHRVAVAEALAALGRVTAATHAEPELLAEDLRLAARALDRLTGRIEVEDVLDRLFAGFCIGK